MNGRRIVGIETMKNDSDWKSVLTPEQYNVTRRGGTEPAFSGELYLEDREGTYHCICCGKELFTSDMKYQSSCGWPSFHTELETADISRVPDHKFGMIRTEVKCSKCDAHLGHVFDDGPRKHGGERYCINSVSMKFVESIDHGYEN
jgi:peptide-methionine (R)-S-oxide reductase